MRDHFIDKEYGGVFWSVDYKGNPLDTKKQIYALAFTLYACSEYYQSTAVEKAKQTAIALYEWIQRYSYDEKMGGYWEAFGRNWDPMEDNRLSDKDANEKKTMSTHLHILEAYTNLYRIWPDEKLAVHQKGLLTNFMQHILNMSTGHLHLFFDENWKVKGDMMIKDYFVLSQKWTFLNIIYKNWLHELGATFLNKFIMMKPIQNRN